MKSLLSAAGVLIFTFALNADEIRGKVVSVTDTVVVLDADKVQHKIRLEGIDAPEKSQAFGQKSKSALGDKIHEKEVVVIWSKKDKYGRTLGDIRLGDRHINLEMVAEGWAWRRREH